MALLAPLDDRSTRFGPVEADHQTPSPKRVKRTAADIVGAAYSFARGKRKQRLAVKDIKALLATAMVAARQTNDPRVDALVDDLTTALGEAQKHRVEMATGLVDAAISDFLSGEVAS